MYHVILSTDKVLLSKDLQILNKMKKNKKIIILLGLLAFVSCTWTETKPLDFKNTPPWEQDVNEAYWAQLRAYKEGRHKLSYAVFNNASSRPAGEKDFLRSLPDSLDYVSLANSDRISEADISDIAVLHKKGTKVLYCVDFASMDESEMKDGTAMENCIDRAAERVRTLRLDGFSFTGKAKAGDPSAEALARRLVDRLLSVKKDGQTIVFEGNPLFVPSDRRGKIDYYAIATENLSTVSEIEREIASATGYIGLPARKIIVSSVAGKNLKSLSGEEESSIIVSAEIVNKNSTLAGFAVHDAGGDYNHSVRNYHNICSAINLLNQ